MRLSTSLLALFVVFLAGALCTCGVAAEDRVNVIFRPGVTALEQTRILVHDGATALHHHGRLHSSTAMASKASQAALRSAAGVVGVEEDFVVMASVNPVQASEVTGTSTPSPEGIPYGVYRIDGMPGSRMNTGAGIVIAIVDTGIDLTHPDLAANIVGNYNAINSTKTGNDDNGHGSHCAGTAAAAQNGVGVIGVAPEAGLLAVKVLDRFGSGYSSDVAEGITWAADHGAQVISMSLGSSSSSSLIQTAVQYAAVHNIVICAAAGNDGNASPGSSNVNYPGAYPECMAISAWTDLDGTPAATGAISPWGDPDESLASFSCTGAEVAFTAPGVQIYSTWKSGGYNTSSGTSMATPHAAGVAALNIKAGKPDVRAAMAARAETVSGTPEEVGAGLVRASPVPNQPPVLAITAPADGATVFNNAPVTLTATALDPEQGDLSSQIVWSSNLDGALGSGGSIAVSLSLGDHQISASVTDAGGMTATVTRTLQVILPPPTPVRIAGLSLQLVNRLKDLQVNVTVKDDQGNVLPNMTIVVRLDLDGSFWRGRQVTTGADGTATFTQTAVPVGTFSVRVTKVLTANTTWDGISPVQIVTKLPPVPVRITGLSLELVNSLKDLQVQVTVQDDQENLLPNMTVLVYLYLDGVFWRSRQVTTGLDGTVTFVQTVAPPGTFTAQVMKVVTTNTAWDGISPVPSLTKPAPIPVRITGLSLEWVNGQDLQVQVTVQDDHANALPNMTVIVRLYLNGVFWRSQQVTTGPDGTVTFVQTGAPAGTFTARVVKIVTENTAWDGNSPVPSITR